MDCSVDGCGRTAHYKEAQLCAMHYHRLRRNGTTTLVKVARPRYEDPKGYQFIYEPAHPLTCKGQCEALDRLCDCGCRKVVAYRMEITEQRLCQLLRRAMVLMKLRTDMQVALTWDRWRRA